MFVFYSCLLLLLVHIDSNLHPFPSPHPIPLLPYHTRLLFL
jgi:hypothetical protein